MRDIWYSDNRDLVKWGFLMHMAKRYDLHEVIQVPYWRPEQDRPSITFESSTFLVPEVVWQFFRNIKHIEHMGGAFDIPVKVLTDVFNSKDRQGYSLKVREQIGKSARPLLLFLDPDTGLEPSRATDTHVTQAEVRDAWSALHKNEWLVLYQHARRTSHWIEEVAEQLRATCGNSPVQVARSERVGSDVAFLCVKKSVA